MARIDDTRFIGDNAVRDEDILLDNGDWLRGRNNANNADVNLLRADAGDRLVLGDANNSIVVGAQRATDPSSPVAGQWYYNTTDNAFRFYDGTTWAEMGGGGGGANTALSNLDVTTNITQDLTFNKTTATITSQPSTNNSIILRSSNNAGGSSGNTQIITGDALNSVGQLTIAGGNSTNNADGGTVIISGGQGTDRRGSIEMNSASWLTLPIVTAEDANFNGPIWYNSTLGKFRGRQGGVNVDLGGGGGGANTTLSNLDTPTAINQDLILDATRKVILKNNVAFSSRNALDNATFDLIKYNASNQVVLAHAATSVIPAATNIAFGNSTFPWGSVDLNGQINLRTGSSDSVTISGSSSQSSPNGTSYAKHLRTSGAGALGIWTDNRNVASGSVSVNEIALATGNNATTFTGTQFTWRIRGKTGNLTGSNSTSGQTGGIEWTTGNATGAANSGDFTVTTGTVDTGTRGRAIFDARTLKLPTASAAPTATDAGEMYYDTTTNKSYTWDGATWQAHW